MIMKTKDRIRDTARKLFNRDGVGKVSVRDICGELKISSGNFSYHYPNKDTIVLDLYLEMREEIGLAIASIAENPVSIRFYLETHAKVFQIQYKYIFFYLNLFDILSHFPEVRKVYRKLHKKEREMAAQGLQMFVQAGILDREPGKEEMERIINVGQMLNLTWAVDAQINFKGNRRQMMAHYMHICCGLLEPYLSPASLLEYQDYFKALEIHKAGVRQK